VARSSVAKKATGAATATLVNGPQIVQLPGQNNRQNKPLPLSLQAARLARRCQLAPERAATIAALAPDRGGRA
jgi:hypothetical protein